jgi:hypothetical protein
MEGRQGSKKAIPLRLLLYISIYEVIGICIYVCVKGIRATVTDTVDSQAGCDCGSDCAMGWDGMGL